MRTRRTRNFLKHSRLVCLDALGFDTPCFSYTLIKLAHCANFISFTKKQTHKKERFYLKGKISTLNIMEYIDKLTSRYETCLFLVCAYCSNPPMKGRI